MTTQSNVKQTSKRGSTGLKALIIGSLILLLLIPSFMITNLIKERQERRIETIREITSKWGGEQVITGPVLLVPYLKPHRNGKNDEDFSFFQILPSELKVEGKIDPSIRYRGIYNVTTYSSDILISGVFNSTDLKNIPENYSKIYWGDTKIAIGISDLMGLKTNASIKIDEQEIKLNPGKIDCDMFAKGMQCNFNLNETIDHTFEILLNVDGSESLFITPVGNQTLVSLYSAWKDPSFDGSYLPSERVVNDSGFTAQWKVFEANRSFPQIFNKSSAYYNSSYENLGVTLILPVDNYQKSTRSVKYAILFIALTFLLMFFAELTTAIRVHPIEYSIVGFALILFYSLLIALSEHIGFNAAYGIASLTIVGMNTAYIHSVYKRLKNTLIIAASLTLLYSFLFVIMQISDYALLVGNIGLVVILGFVMFYSRKIEWYGEKNTETELRLHK